MPLPIKSKEYRLDLGAYRKAFLWFGIAPSVWAYSVFLVAVSAVLWVVDPSPISAFLTGFVACWLVVIFAARVGLMRKISTNRTYRQIFEDARTMEFTEDGVRQCHEAGGDSFQPWVYFLSAQDRGPFLVLTMVGGMQWILPWIAIATPQDEAEIRQVLAAKGIWKTKTKGSR